MKSKIMLLALAGGTALLFAADSPRKGPSKIDQLQAKIAALEQRVTAVEARLAVRAEFIHLTPSPAPSAPGQQMPLKYLEEPPNIGSIEVNGLKFFWVPIDSTESQ